MTTPNQTPDAAAPETASPKIFKMKKMSNKAIIIIAIVVAVIVILGALAYRYKSLVIAATINGHPITRIAVIKELEKQGGKTTLDGMINNQLIDDAAKAKNITITDADINANIDTLTTQLAAQGETLANALAQQGMTNDDLKKQIRINKELEQLLADKIQVSDDEITKYISDNKVTIPAGQEAATKDQIKQQLQQQKLSAAAQDYVNSLRSAAKIKTYVNY